jgi:hypothetical protein
MNIFDNKIESASMDLLEIPNNHSSFEILNSLIKEKKGQK